MLYSFQVYRFIYVLGVQVIVFQVSMFVESPQKSVPTRLPPPPEDTYDIYIYIYIYIYILLFCTDNEPDHAEFVTTKTIVWLQLERRPEDTYDIIYIYIHIYIYT